jgi:hypothetical protein
MTTWQDVFREMLREVIIGSIVNDVIRKLKYDIDTYGEDVVCAFLDAYPTSRKVGHGED